MTVTEFAANINFYRRVESSSAHTHLEIILETAGATTSTNHLQQLLKWIAVMDSCTAAFKMANCISDSRRIRMMHGYICGENNVLSSARVIYREANKVQLVKTKW